VQFVLFGSLTVIDSTGECAALGGARLRVLLATLLLHANKPVSTEALADAVWDGAPPAGAATTLRGHVLRLRRALGSEAGARIVVHDPGYLVRVADSELDVLEFQKRCLLSGDAIHAHDWAGASAAATEALALWQGTPLVDVPCQALRDAWLPRLEQARIQALEWRIDADLHLGRRDQLVPELHTLVAEHPLRERFHIQLMLALAGAGRQTEALAAYQEARRVLIDELGIEPGPELRELQERILAGDAGLLHAPRPASESVPTDRAVVPRQLPAATGHFVGREAELKTLAELLSWRTEAGGSVVISAIGGTAGIGKTALAVYWAHQSAPDFPDGQLYINLRGFGPSPAPVPPAEAIRRFLDALGVPSGNMPVDPEDLAALYRSRLADRRVLILLDNARDAEQVRPLLPGTPGALAIVTSRNQLGGLVALDGAVPLTLDLLTESEACELLARRLGSERIRSDESTAVELVNLCARLPLALNIAAARAALHPARPLSELVDELRDTRRRLSALTTEDAAADLRTVFSWSYCALSEEAAHLFRLLGLFPGASIPAHAAAALSDLPLDRAERLLEALVNASLLEGVSAGRYRFHDLLRAYAAEMAQQESAESRHSAICRVGGWYLYASHQAMTSLRVYAPPVDIESAARSEPALDLPDGASAMAWYDLERANIRDLAQLARTERLDQLVPLLALCMQPYYMASGRWEDAVALNDLAQAAAHDLGDLTVQARLLNNLSTPYVHLGRADLAVEASRQALELHTSLGNVGKQAHCMVCIADAFKALDRMDEAFDWYQRAVALYQQVDAPIELAFTVNNLAYSYILAGRYEDAVATALEAVELARGQSTSIAASALDTLGTAYLRAGKTDQAIHALREAVEAYADSDDRYLSADALDHYGDALASASRTQEALAIWRRAVELFDGVDDERAAAIGAKSVNTMLR
jgi:DNA-binding SARP family transcriptional activator/tetratricopeptide (TPR) repeat protein